MPVTQASPNLESLYKPLWLGAWIAAAWLVLIALNLATLGLFDIAVRDLAMAVGAYTLARLAELRQESPATAPASALRTSRA